MRSIPKIVLTLVAVGALTLPASSKAQSGTPAAHLAAALARAREAGDTKAVRRLTNQQAAMRLLPPSQLKGIRCGRAEADRFTVVESEIGQDVAGQLLTNALERIAPALAAVVASAPAAGVAVFLAPERIAPDAVEILNGSETRNRDEVRNAARSLLETTLSENFERLPRPLMAKVLACSL